MIKYAWQKIKKGDKIFYHILTGRGEKVLTHGVATGEKCLGLIFLEDGKKIFGGDISCVVRNGKEVL